MKFQDPSMLGSEVMLCMTKCNRRTDGRTDARTHKRPRSNMPLQLLRVYYENLLHQLRTAICEKCRGKLSKGVLLQQNNATVHTCKVAMDAVE